MINPLGLATRVTPLFTSSDPADATTLDAILLSPDPLAAAARAVTVCGLGSPDAHPSFSSAIDALVRLAVEREPEDVVPHASGKRPAPVSASGLNPSAAQALRVTPASGVRAAITTSPSPAPAPAPVSASPPPTGAPPAPAHGANPPPAPAFPPVQPVGFVGRDAPPPVPVPAPAAPAPADLPPLGTADLARILRRAVRHGDSDSDSEDGGTDDGLARTEVCPGFPPRLFHSFPLLSAVLCGRALRLPAQPPPFCLLPPQPPCV